jgi:hypothetical protein
MSNETDTALALMRPDFQIERAPAEVIQEARSAAKALADLIATKERPLIFNDKQYLEFSDWQLLARFFGITARVESTRPLELFGVTGFEAVAVAIAADGRELSRAEAMCTTDEKNWAKKPLFQLRSMAQTRAARKVLATVLAWVPVLAGCEPDALEEMDQENEFDEGQTLFKRAKALLERMGKADEETELALERFAQLDVETAREKVIELERRARQREGEQR